MEDIPCSRVGHIYRKYVPYKVPTGVSLARVSGSDVPPHPACDQTAASWKVLQSKSSSIFSISSYKNVHPQCGCAIVVCYPTMGGKLRLVVHKLYSYGGQTKQLLQRRMSSTKGRESRGATDTYRQLHAQNTSYC